MTIVYSDNNRFLATIWFLLSALILILSPIIFISVPLLSVGTVSFAVILFLLGRQRLQKYRMSDKKFNRTIFILALLIVFSSSLSTIFITTEVSFSFLYDF